MKKPISLLLAAQSILLIAIASLFLSSCIIVHPDDEVIVEKKTTVVSGGTTGGSTPANPTPPSNPNPPASTKHSITCRNETSYVIQDWCVKKDNTVTFANSSFNRSIQPDHEDRIVNLEEGYYVVYFSFEDDYPLEPWDYRSSESVWLDRDVTYCLYERAQVVSVACRSASAEPQLYLAGSDGSEIDLICK